MFRKYPIKNSSKPILDNLGAIAIVLFVGFSPVIFAVNAGYAQRQPTFNPGGSGPMNPNDTIRQPTPNRQPNKPGRVVGSCDSGQGCAILASSCKAVPGYWYEDTPSGGVCKKPETASSSTSSPNLVAETRDSRDAFCHDIALCNAMRDRCSGEWKQLTPTSGRCEDRKPSNR